MYLAQRPGSWCEQGDHRHPWVSLLAVGPLGSTDRARVEGADVVLGRLWEDVSHFFCL
jgi:hypothetical protein